MPQLRTFQFGMKSAMVTVAGAAACLAAYRILDMQHIIPHYLLLLMCIIATTGVVHPTGRRRAFWLGVTIVCAAHFVSGFRAGILAPVFDWQWWRNIGIYLVLHTFVDVVPESPEDVVAAMLALPTWLLTISLLSVAGGGVAVWAHDRFRDES